MSTLDNIPAEVEQFTSWNALSDRIRDQEDLDEQLRAHAIDAVSRLAKILGPRWLLNVASKSESLGFDLIFNRAPWTREQWVQIANDLDLVLALKGRGRRRLIEGLRNPSESDNYMFEADVAARALEAGLRVQLGPMIHGTKSSDLLVSDGVEAIHCEISTLSRFPQAFEEAQVLSDRVYFYPRLLAAGLDGGGRFLAMPEGDEVEDLVFATSAFWAEAQRAQRPMRFTYRGLVELWAAPRGDPPEPGTRFTGPPMANDPLGRIARRIRAKAEYQLPRGKPGIVVIDPPALMGVGLVQSPILPNCLSEYPDVSAGLIVRRQAAIQGQVPEYQRGEGFLYRARLENTAHMREVVLLWNPMRTHQDVEDLVVRLFHGL
jgi:hypothetical protein